MPKKHTWDLFISHATEDKESIVQPLANALASFGLRVWYDEFTLTAGDSLSRSIDKGLADSNYGVVVLSPAFFEKHWSEYELRGLTAREISGRKVIIPIWHNVTRNQVLKFSPPLADKLALKSSGRSTTELAIGIIEVTNPELLENIHLRIAALESRDRVAITKINAREIKVGPMRHKKLPDELVGRIRLIRAALLGVHTHSMKYWLDGFQRDAHPSSEIAIWERICATIHEYSAINELTPEQVPHVFQVALGLTNGSTPRELASDLKALPPDSFTIISRLMLSNVPVYDIDEPADFTGGGDRARAQRKEDRQLFPIDLPDHLLKPLVKTKRAQNKK
jgi:hypothetical protein